MYYSMIIICYSVASTKIAHSTHVLTQVQTTIMIIRIKISKVSFTITAASWWLSLGEDDSTEKTMKPAVENANRRIPV